MIVLFISTMVEGSTVRLDMQPIVILLIGSITTIVPPLLMAWLVNRNSLNMKKADYARQDELKVAEQVRQDLVAQRILDAAARAERHSKENASLFLLSNAQVVASSLRNGEKLDVLKIQGDGHMTALIQSELNMTKVALRSMKNGVAKDKLAKIATSKDTLAEIKSVEARACELQKALNVKVKIDKVAHAMPGGGHTIPENGEGK